MKNLAMAAVSSLEQANLREVLETLHQRVFDRPSGELCETERMADGRWRLRYKPMVELLLREVIEVTRTRGVTREEQRRRIGWTLDVAGF